MEEKNPVFSVVNVMPGYVIGKNELADSRAKLRAGSNHVVLNIVTGIVNTNKVVGTVVDVRDVARVQVEALDETKVPGNYRNFVVEEPVELNDAVAIVKQAFPEAFEKGVLMEGSSVSVYQVYEGKDTREIFGELKTYEEMVKSVVGHYIELET
jgi:nucleoside-diphosphate-sugar epimerase